MVPESKLFAFLETFKRYQIVNIVIEHAKKEIQQLTDLQKYFPHEHDSLERLKKQWETLIHQQEQKPC